MAFNNEDKVSYKELAPSLKRLFKNLEKEIKERQIGYIDDNAKYIDRLKDKLTALENRDDLKELYKMAKNDDEESASGQVLKINPSKRSLYQHDEFLNRRIVSNQYEKEEEMLRVPTSMETIFKTWKRYAHFDGYASAYLDETNHNVADLPEGQNLNNYEYNLYLDPNQTGWVFDKKTNCIRATYDGHVTAGFISPTSDYYSYYIKTMVDVGWDDDNLMIVLGYTVDENGKEHTLSLVRGAGNLWTGSGKNIESFIKDGKRYYNRIGYNIPIPGSDYGPEGFKPGNPSINYPRDKWRDKINYRDIGNLPFDTTFWWGLIYDMGNDTQFIITDLSDEVGPSAFPTNYASRASVCIAYISALREGNYFKFTTSEWSKDGSDDKQMPEGTFEFTLPDEKPEHWSDEMFENMKKMCLEPSHVGFGCRSGQPRFTIMDQRGIFDDEDIYSLYEDKIFSFNSQKFSWEFKEKISENKNFTQKIFLYNPKLKTLYWYNDVFDYTRITIPPDLKELTRPGKDGQILKYNGRTDFLQYDDEFHICNVVDNDNDFNLLQNSKFSMKDIFYNWDRISGIWDWKFPTEYKNQNLNTEGQIAARNAYYFDDTTQQIINPRNSNETSAFLSKDYYKSFKVKIRLDPYNDDDDPIFMIVGFMTDDKGIQHDISVVRCGNNDSGQHKTGPLFIMYDAMSYLYAGDSGDLTPNNIRDHNSKEYKMLVLKGLEYGVIKPVRWDYGPVEIEIERGKKRDGTPFLEIRTCNPNEHIDYDNPDFRLYYELPTTIPEYWTAEQYLNVRNMLTNESRIGFGTQSNPCKISILSQTGFLQDDLIYHLKKDRVYRRVNGNDWEEIGTVPEYMMSKVLMYNKSLKKLFWYNNEVEDKTTTDYFQLSSRPSITPQIIPDNEGIINSTIEVVEYYSQELTSSVKVVPITRKEISATIQIQ